MGDAAFGQVFRAQDREFPVSFCAACGTILDLPVGSGVACDRCGQWVPTEALLRADAVITQTRSKTEQERAIKESAAERAEIDEACVKCGEVGLWFHTMQTRSADEGATVFYECKVCAHRWTQNN